MCRPIQGIDADRLPGKSLVADEAAIVFEVRDQHRFDIWSV